MLCAVLVIQMCKFVIRLLCRAGVLFTMSLAERFLGTEDSWAVILSSGDLIFLYYHDISIILTSILQHFQEVVLMLYP